MSASESRPIAILGGTGPAGMGLALRWARAGESIIIGSRNAERARESAARIKEKTGAEARVSGVENHQACAAADVLVLTVPFEGQAELLKQLKSSISAGSVLIDATVPLAASGGGRPLPARVGSLAGFSRAANRRTRTQTSERGCGLSQSFRRSPERRSSPRLRRDCL